MMDLWLFSETKLRTKIDTIVIDDVIIDCEFKNLIYFCVDLEQNFHTKPIEIPIKFCDFFPIEFFSKEESFLYFYPVDGSSDYKKIAFHPNTLFIKMNKLFYTSRSSYFYFSNFPHNHYSDYFLFLNKFPFLLFLLSPLEILHIYAFLRVIFFLKKYINIYDLIQNCI